MQSTDKRWSTRSVRTDVGLRSSQASTEHWQAAPSVRSPSSASRSPALRMSTPSPPPPCTLVRGGSSMADVRFSPKSGTSVERIEMSAWCPLIPSRPRSRLMHRSTASAVTREQTAVVRFVWKEGLGLGDVYPRSQSGYDSWHSTSTVR